MSDFKCPRDTDGDGNCAACARRPGGCFEKPQTDNIAQLREAYNESSIIDWDKDSDVFSDCGCWPDPVEGGLCKHEECEMYRGNRDFAILAHNEFGKIMAVLAEADALAAYDDYEGPRVPTWDNFRKALSVLKGGTE